MENMFGTCPFCGKGLSWDNDDTSEENEECLARYCHCDNCGASVAAFECPEEERKDYPYYVRD